MELAENVKGLVEPQPAFKKDSPSTVVDQEKIQRYDGSANAPETHASGNYRHNECVFDLALPCSRS